jgi:glucose-6-phosphate 1-dehydrogenase
MTAARSDAFVFFGATGDLAYKQIFPALQGLIRDEGFSLPIIGVAKAGWTLEQLKTRARESLEHHGSVDQAAFEKLSGLLRYVDGDYNDADTFAERRDRSITSPFLRVCSLPWPRVSPRPAVPPTLVSSWRSRSDAT